MAQGTITSANPSPSLGTHKGEKAIIVAGTWGAAAEVKLQWNSPNQGWQDTGNTFTAASPSDAVRLPQGEFRLLADDTDGATALDYIID